MISLWTFLWLMDIPPSWWCYKGSNLPGVYVLVGNIELTSFSWWEFDYLQNIIKVLLFISMRGNQDLTPRLYYVSWLFLSCLCILSLPLISIDLNPLIGNLGNGMKPISYNQETGDTEKLLCPGVPQSPACYQFWLWTLRLSVMSDYLQPHGLWQARLLCLWDSLGKNIGVECHFLL